jgi:hypothetical protein
MVWVWVDPQISISFCAGTHPDPDLEASEVALAALSFSKTAFLAPEGTLDGLDLLAIVRYSNIL